MEVNLISDYDGPFNYTVGLIKLKIEMTTSI